MGKQYLQFGKDGERIAVDYLEAQGYEIICRNYCSGLGEIDIIAWDEDAIVFIEVKRRSTNQFGFPQESINKKKQYQIMKSALVYIKKEKINNLNLRFDVVAICGNEIDLIKNAFSLNERYKY